MFITNASLEHCVPDGIGSTNSRYWLAVLLSQESPWFLLSHKAEHGLAQSIAVAWEWTLLEVLNQVGPDAVIALYWVLPDPYQPGQWAMKDIAELWLPCGEDVYELGPILMRVRGELSLTDAFRRSVKDDADRRSLLASFQGPASAS